MLRSVLSLASLVSLLCAPGLVEGFVMQVDGYSHVGMVLVAPDRIVCSKIASGQKQAELFCLDTKTRKIVWRQNVPEPTWNGTADGATAFYHVAGDILFKRSLNTGQVIWQTPLASISAQKSPRIVTWGDKASALLDDAKGLLGLPASGVGRMAWTVGSGGTPNSFGYQGPFASGANLVLCRDARHHSGGCTVMHCFSDWLLIDPVHGRHLGGGDGEFLGAVEGMCLIGGPNSRIVRNGSGERHKELERLFGTFPDSLIFIGWNDLGLYSCKNRCLMPIHAKTNSALIFDKSDNWITTVETRDRSDYQCEWVLLADRVFRFSQCVSPNSNGHAKALPSWAELYDLKGRLVKSVEEPVPVNGDDWIWSCVGITSREDVVLRNGNEIVVLSIPSLKMSARYVPQAPPNKPQDWTPADGWHLPRGRDGVFQVWGDTFLSEMDQERVTHPIGVRMLDVYTGKPAWEYSETINIRKVRR